MNAQKKVRKVLAASSGEGVPPSPFGQSDNSPPTGTEAGKRNIPKDFEFNPKALKPLSRMLLSMSISLGHALTAHREFTKLKSSSISPDGLVGGRGYVLNVKDVRSKLQQACELISSVSDTIHDEINAPHWKSTLGELGKNDAEDISEFLDESRKVMDDPEGYADEDLDDVEEKNDGPDGTSNEEKATQDPRFNGPSEDIGSQTPGGGGGVSRETKPSEKVRPKTASIEERLAARWLAANSSIPVQTLPGPRVQHLDRGDSDQTGPGGSYNKEEPRPMGDEWGQNQGVGSGKYKYPSEWEGRLRAASDTVWGQSSVPDAATDSTPTEAEDFGLGWGAKGQGSKGYGTVAPDGKGVAGPTSGLPDDAGGGSPGGDTSLQMNVENHRNLLACGCQGGSELPNDGEPPVARSDYYRGDKGNQFNVNLAESELPSGPQNGLSTDDLIGPNVADRWQDQAVPYVKWDQTTHNYRHDPQDLWDDQRDFYSYNRNNDG